MNDVRRWYLAAIMTMSLWSAPVTHAYTMTPSTSINANHDGYVMVKGGGRSGGSFGGRSSGRSTSSPSYSPKYTPRPSPSYNPKYNSGNNYKSNNYRPSGFRWPSFFIFPIFWGTPSYAVGFGVLGFINALLNLVFLLLIIGLVIWWFKRRKH